MGLNFYDYLDFQKNQGGYRLMKHTVLHKGCHPIVPITLIVKKLIYSRTRNNTSSLAISNPKFSNWSLISDFLDLKLIMKLGPNLNLRSYLKL